MIGIALLTIIVGYLLGSIPSAYIAGRLAKGVDIRQVGGGNMGAVNTFREIGASAGIAVLVADVGKSAAAVLIAKALAVPEPVVLLTGLAAVAGHNWTPFLRFSGGKGTATTIGVFLVLMPREMLIILGIIAIPIFITHNPVLSIAIGFLFLPLVAWYFERSGLLIGYSLAVPLLVGLKTLPSAREAFAKAENTREFIFDRWRRDR